MARREREQDIRTFSCGQREESGAIYLRWGQPSRLNFRLFPQRFRQCRPGLPSTHSERRDLGLLLVYRNDRSPVGNRIRRLGRRVVDLGLGCEEERANNGNYTGENFFHIASAVGLPSLHSKVRHSKEKRRPADCPRHPCSSLPISARSSSLRTLGRRKDSDTVSRYRFRRPVHATPAREGSLEWFLVERYVLFTADRAGNIRSGRVHHEPYRIAEAMCDEWSSAPYRGRWLGPRGRTARIDARRRACRFADFSPAIATRRTSGRGDSSAPPHVTSKCSQP
jgi:hypothetical protein